MPVGVKSVNKLTSARIGARFLDQKFGRATESIELGISRTNIFWINFSREG